MKRVQREILAGTILVILSVVIVLIMGFREQNRLEEYVEFQGAAKIEFGAAVYETNCTSCHGPTADGIPGLAPSLRDHSFFAERIDEVGWAGSLEDYIVSVVTTGRQVSTRPEQYVGGGSPAMPTWSDAFGGPLRKDQISAVAAFIMNFEAYALGDVPTPVPLAPLEDLSDPVALGRATFTSAGCIACHTVSGLSTGIVGPVLDGVGTRAGGMSDLSAEEYLRESILNPDVFMVEDFSEGIMPQTFGDTLSEEQLDSLIAFLLTLE